MAERIVSPGVFTREIDQSFLTQGIQAIGAAIVGPTVKGPALVPTRITSLTEYNQIFGSNTADDYYVPIVVQDYLSNGSVITVTRILYEDGYYLNRGALAIVAESGSGVGLVKKVSHILHPTRPVTTTGLTGPLFQSSSLTYNTSLNDGSFSLVLSGSYSAPANSAIGFDGSFLSNTTIGISCSIVDSSNQYISTVLGTSPASSNYPVYVQYEAKKLHLEFADITKVTASLQIIDNYEFLQDYNVASTPWITSQTIGGATTDLFKFHTLSHGTSVNHEVKIGIKDIKLAPGTSGNGTELGPADIYGTFTVQLRRVNTLSPGIPGSPYASQDTDASPDIIQEWEVNLDPDSPKYIARVIGDSYQTVTDAGQVLFNGSYPTKNNFVRVEVSEDVRNKIIDKTLIPFGFRAPSSPIPLVSSSLALPSASYRNTQIVAGAYSGTSFYGFDYTAATNMNYLSAIPTSGSNTGSSVDFYLGNILQDTASNFPDSLTPYTGSLQNALINSTFINNVKLSTRRFMVPFQGGFDGARPNLPKYRGEYIASNNTYGFDCQTSTSTGTKSYNKAFLVLSNADYYDMNLLITPGLIDSLHSSATSLARNLCQTRQDTFYIMDSNAINDSIATVTSQVATLDTNYTAVYWPWMSTINSATGAQIFVPPSVLLPNVFAFNDKTASPWYAPAGLQRGKISAIGTKVSLAQADRDTLYQARVNPIANFGGANGGIVVWGQKTLQARPSALDRINVRRLLIAVKKFIASSTRFLVFEQNSVETRNRFLAIVNPYMESVRVQQGLYAFRVIMDDKNNTPDLIDQNILYGQIFLQPTRTAEFIVLDFNIQPTGAAF
jgi:hypothetical protein